MVSARTIARILLEGIGEFMILVSALVYSLHYTYSRFPSIKIIILLLAGVGLRIYADEIYLTTRDGKWKERLLHWEK